MKDITTIEFFLACAKLKIRNMRDAVVLLTLLRLGGRATIKEVISEIESSGVHTLARSTVTDAITSLLDRKVVSRIVSKEDRRQVVLEVTNRVSKVIQP